MIKRSDKQNISRETLENYRFKAIELRKKGWQVNKIAEAFGVHRGSVSRWLTKSSRCGKDSLKRTKAKGKPAILTNEDKKELVSWLKNSAMDYDFETPLWTCKRIQRVIKDKLNKSIVISSLWETLRKLGLTPQKPERNSLEKDEKESERWVNEEWPKIQKHAKRWQAMLYFQDESAVSLTPVLGKTWAPKGQTPKIKVTGKRGTVCVSSAISPAGRMVFRIEKQNFSSKTFIDFLKQIIKQHVNRKIIVIVDNSPVHTAKAVKTFAEEHKKNFAIYYLPTYSPDLNPDEEVWNYLKNQKLKAHQSRNKKEFVPLVLSKLRSMQRNTNLISSFFINTYVT